MKRKVIYTYKALRVPAILKAFCFLGLGTQLAHAKGNLPIPPVGGAANQVVGSDSNDSESADWVNKHSVGLGLGQTFLLGEMKKNGRDAITGDIFYAYSASYSFDLVANAHYSKHEFQDRSTTLLGGTASIKGRIYDFDSFSPFAMAGLGFYRPVMERQGDNGIETTEGRTTFGNSLGGGVDLRLNNRAVIGALWQYHNPFDVRQDKGPKVEGSYHKLMLTFMYAL